MATKAPRQARWSIGHCKRCRDLARRAACNARRRDRSGLKVARELQVAFPDRWFRAEDAAALAAKFGRDLPRLQALLLEMGQGSYDPLTQAGFRGDGVLAERVVDGHQFFRFDVGLPRTVAFENVALSGVDVPVIHAGKLDGASAEVLPQRGAPILDSLPVGNGSEGHAEGVVDAATLRKRIAADLHRARERRCVLLRVSVTMPKWNYGSATLAAHIFRQSLLALGASGLLLARDRRPKTGAPHWYGLVAVPEGVDRNGRKAVRSRVRNAWMAASSATSECIWVCAVTGWDAFVESDGDMDARIGKDTFRMNLMRVLGYTFKPWPELYGVRNLETDVVEAGFFEGSTLGCAT